MSNNMSTRQCLDYAEELRTIAENDNNEDNREILLSIAHSYLRMAATREAVERARAAIDEDRD